MIIVLSPAKTLKRLSLPHQEEIQKYFQSPSFLEETSYLVEKLKKLNEKDLEKLLDVSYPIARLNYERYKNFPEAFTFGESYPAIFLFYGDVYKGLSLQSYSIEELEFLQKHVRILSGLYGILRPFDLIYPYRLEMGTGFQKYRDHFGFSSLYEYWGKKITDFLNGELSTEKNRYLINLASGEYFQVLQTSGLSCPVIHIHFQEFRNGKFTTIAVNAKRARGIMTNWIIRNRIDEVEKIKEFSLSGYRFSEEKSDPENFYFLKS